MSLSGRTIIMSGGSRGIGLAIAVAAARRGAAAVQNLLGGEDAIEKSRTPAIVADAAVEIHRRISHLLLTHVKQSA